jgi:hypothetical protein
MARTLWKAHRLDDVPPGSRAAGAGPGRYATGPDERLIRRYPTRTDGERGWSQSAGTLWVSSHGLFSGWAQACSLNDGRKIHDPRRSKAGSGQILNSWQSIAAEQMTVRSRCRISGWWHEGWHTSFSMEHYPGSMIIYEASEKGPAAQIIASAASPAYSVSLTSCVSPEALPW